LASSLGTVEGCVHSAHGFGRGRRATAFGDILLSPGIVLKLRGQWSMPAISRFLGVIISMYYDDHSPPHFHVKYAEYND